MMYIFGSEAIRYYYDDFRESKDIDILIKDKDSLDSYDLNFINFFKNYKRIEYHWNDVFNYLEEINSDTILHPDLIFTIKISHACYDINFYKHIKDILFLRDKDCQIDYIFLNKLREAWDRIHGPKHGYKTKINLNKPNKDFFNPNVFRYYEHDELHKILCFYDEPLYNKILNDTSTPLCSEDKFKLLSDEDKLKCALEEVMVIATERFIIPKKYSIRRAKLEALKKLITSMTKNWFNIYLILNFDKIIDSENETWEQKLKQQKII